MKNILAFILLLCITSPAVGQRVKKSHEDIVFAAELMHQAYEEEAREILDSMLSVDHNNSDALFLRSLDYWHNGEIHRAIEYCSKAIETYSRGCYYDLDYMYYRRGDMYYSYSINYSNAIEDYSKALDLMKKRDYIQRCRILYNRAQCYYEIGEYKKAKQDLLSALDCDYDTLKDNIRQQHDIRNEVDAEATDSLIRAVMQQYSTHVNQMDYKPQSTHISST